MSIVCLIVSGSTFAQSYNTAIGLRIDDGFNVTAKQAITKKYVLEGMLHAPLLSKDVGATLLLERHRKLIGRNLSMYYGAGPHFYWTNNGKASDEAVTNKVFGASVIGGLDLCLGRLNISVDVLPEVHLTGEPERVIDFNGAAVSARYIINKKERTKLRDRVNLPKRKTKTSSSKKSGNTRTQTRNWRFWEKD